MGKAERSKWAGAHESRRAASEFQLGQGRWRTNRTGVHRCLVVACGVVDRIGIINYHDVRDGGKLGSSRRGDLVKPVLSGSKELVAETKFYSNRGPILPHHK